MHIYAYASHVRLNNVVCVTHVIYALPYTYAHTYICTYLCLSICIYGTYIPLVCIPIRIYAYTYADTHVTCTYTRRITCNAPWQSIYVGPRVRARDPGARKTIAHEFRAHGGRRQRGVAALGPLGWRQARYTNPGPAPCIFVGTAGGQYGHGAVRTGTGPWPRTLIGPVGPVGRLHARNFAWNYCM